MTDFDLVIRGGTVAGASEVRVCDIGITGGRIAALGAGLSGATTLDARGKLVLPGGIDSHCHVEQLSSMGVMCADDFYSASVSAAFGGTTTIIPFCAQHRGDSLAVVLADYHDKARTKAVVDYGFHLIIANPDAATLDTDLPAAIASGIRSFKIFMTYERMRLHDEQILDVMAAARRDGALLMVHAENHGMISWLAGRLLKQGNAAPRYHAICHTRGSEAEAIQRIVALAELMDCPILIVHVSTAEGIEAIRTARARGLQVLGETCPQYLFLTAKDIDRGLEGAMFCCSPPPRDAAGQEACWQGLKDGALQVYSSDHAPYRFDATGKLPKGAQTTFKEMANGVPGLELRLPLLFSEGYLKGRLTLREFIDLGSTRHAQTYGIYPQKGVIAIGADADLAIWDPEKRVHISAAMLHDNAGYTPYAGRELTGWPVTVLSRGEVIVHEGKLNAARGRGRFLARAMSDASRPAGKQVPEMAQLAEWNTPLQL
ncbi:MAG: dihydropyrimidinase [Betaproteobacteria bacterium]|nr:dihydropyrimidinase [Betaproteobacteria bacterium]MSQ89536.1 dihydropyrimidinase [Betaproteobacteria bacterium]